MTIKGTNKLDFIFWSLECDSTAEYWHLLMQHARGDWLEQDKKLNRRIAERLQDVEPAQHGIT